MGKNFAKILLTEGFFFLVLGIIILISPQIAGLWTLLLISLGLIVGGIYKIISSITMRKEIDTPWFAALIGLLSIGGGIYIKLNPFFSLMLFCAVIIAYLMLDGIYSILTAIKTKKYSKGWGAVILSGSLQLFLGFLILYWFPQLSLITLGIFIGANMLTSGLGLIILGSGIKKIVDPN